MVLYGQSSDPVSVLSVVPRDRFGFRAGPFSHFLSMIFRKISGNLFASLLTIVFCIGI